MAQTSSGGAATFVLEVGGVDYPLTKVSSQNPVGASMAMHLLEADMPLGGEAILKATFTVNTSWQVPLVAAVFAGKNVVRPAAPSTLRVTMTAGTPVAIQTATQVGDIALFGMLSIPNAAGGVFDSSAFVSELVERQHTDGTAFQFWLGKGVETAANAARTISVTPNASGEAARFNVLYRNAE